MEFVILSGTNLQASRVGLGTWAMGGWMWGGTDERESIRTIHAALDKGINLIDTAHTFCEGKELSCVDKITSWDTQPTQQGSMNTRSEDTRRAGKTR